MGFGTSGALSRFEASCLEGKRMSEPVQGPAPFKWADKPAFRKKEFLELLNADASKDLFNEKFIEGLEKRRDLLNARSEKVQIIQLTIMVILLISLLSMHMSISFLGLSTPDARGVRELLLIISSSIQLGLAFQTSEQMYIRELLD